MKITLECYACLAKLAVELAQRCITQPSQHHSLIKELLRLIAESSYPITAPEITASFYNHLESNYGVIDPYRHEKRKYNQWVQDNLPRFIQSIRQHSDPLRAALRLAATANVIDFGTPATFEVNDLFCKLDKERFEIDCTESFMTQLHKARTMLVIGDNAGEIGLDRLLLDEIKARFELHIYYVVRGGPIINDATEEDALFFRMNEVATIMDSGSRIPGICLDRISPELRNLFFEVDLIIAKGQGNFETLTEVDRDIFFLLTTKCQPVADILQVGLGSAVLDYHSQNLMD